MTSNPDRWARDDRSRAPIAIVGIGCRFPGAHGPDAFWRLLRNGLDAITEVPSSRLDVKGLCQASPGVPSIRWGGFVEPIDQLDADFFGISPREAERLDPQQRLLLEVAWEAIEDAGQVRERLAGSNTGVFIGLWIADYEARMFADPDRIDFHMTTGTGRYAASGRLSYVLGLRGPSITIDTACSSSLVAVHLACQSLWREECDLALAGGANVVLGPEISIAYSQSKMLAPDGRCKFGDTRANGYVRSEGAGLVVLKPLHTAVADGEPIYALIRGSAANNDGGASGSLGTPSRQGQEELLRRAYRDAGILPHRIDYVEAHGTGTRAGDPVEIQALGTVLGEGRSNDRPLIVGSVKTNVGHTEGAAGVAGLIKTALCLRHRTIPSSLHFEKPNPDIPWSDLPVRIARESGPWPSDSAPAMAGVSAFGIAGTNAHVVLEEAVLDRQAATDSLTSPEAARLLPLSAHTSEALRATAEGHHAFLTVGQSDADPEKSPPSLQDICYTASLRRTHHDHRLALVGRTPDELAAGLEAFLRGDPHPGLATGRPDPSRRPRVVFVFPGQGSQWLGMGRQLLAHDPVFREALERCEQAIREEVGWSLLHELTADESQSRLREIDVIQPTLFAIEVALATLWRAWGVAPDAVVGHSMGEIAAAHVAGALSLADAARIICRRSRLLRRVSGQGAMAVVELSLEQARAALAGYEDRLSIAVSNSPRSTVLSGDPTALAEVLTILTRQDVFCRPVKVDVASHSPQMDPLRADLLQALADLHPHPAPVPIYSTVTGEGIPGQTLDAPYWVRNLREPVLFSAAVQRLLTVGHDIFIEMSPHPILLPAIQQGLTDGGPAATVLPSLRREEDERAVMLESLGALYTQGYPVDWARLYPTRGRCVRLPSYPWQRERFWLETDGTERGGSVRTHQGRPKHPLLGWRVDVAEHTASYIWEAELDRRRLPYLYEHRLHGAAVFPAAAYVEIALAAAADALGATPGRLTDLEFHRALFLPDDDSLTLLQTILAPAGADRVTCRVFSRLRDAWVLHASATVHLTDRPAAPPDPIALHAVQARCAEEITGSDVYLDLQGKGVVIGPSLQSIDSLWKGPDEVLGRIMVREESSRDADAYHFAPAITDSCFQISAALLPTESTAAANDGHSRGTFMPVRIDEINVYGRPVPGFWCHARSRPGGEPLNSVIEEDVCVLDETGHGLVEIRGLCFQSLEHLAARGASGTVNDWLYELRWRPREASDDEKTEPSGAATRPGTWLVLADRSGVAEALARRLRATGIRCVLVPTNDASRLLDEILSPGEPASVKVVHLWSLDAVLKEPDSQNALEHTQALGCASAAQVVRALAEVAWPEPARLWLVTRGAQPVRGAAQEALALAQAPLWGLGRVIAEEHPELWGGLIDLDPATAPEEAAAQLEEVLRSPNGEDQWAFRDGQRFVARLVRSEDSPQQTRALPWRPDASYLITGGLGALGLQVARWMVAQGVRRLILMGRTPLPQRQRWHEVAPDTDLHHKLSAIRDLEALGASVHLAAVDAADEAQLTAFLETFRREGWPPIRGVVHAAGVIEDRLLRQLDLSALWTVLRPKVLGAWLLHRHLHDAPLDFFVLFSSLGAVLGQAGQGNYAAANAFLDALAHHRAAQGRPALSISWGGWTNLGFAATAGGRGVIEHLARRGIRGFSPAQALSVLARALTQRRPHLVAVPVDWARFRETTVTGRDLPLLTDLLRPDASVVQPAPAAPAFRETLLAAEPAQRAALLQSHLQEQLGLVLRLAPSRIDPRKPFRVLGLESLMALEFRNRLERSLGLVLSATLVWNYSTIVALSAHLAERLGLETTSTRDAGPDLHQERGLSSSASARTDQRSLEELQELVVIELAKAEELLKGHRNG